MPLVPLVMNFTARSSGYRYLLQRKKTESSSSIIRRVTSTDQVTNYVDDFGRSHWRNFTMKQSTQDQITNAASFRL